MKSALQPTDRKKERTMKKLYEKPSVTVVPLKLQGALLQFSDGDKTPPIGGGIAMDSIERPHNG